MSLPSTANHMVLELIYAAFNAYPSIPFLTMSTIQSVISKALIASEGDDEGAIEVMAGCLGIYARHCTALELSALLKGGPLAPSAAARSERLGHALTLASVAQYASERYCITLEIPSMEYSLHA